MKYMYWLFLIIALIIGAIAILWFNGTIEKYWMRYAIEHGDQDRIRILLQKGVSPHVY